MKFFKSIVLAFSVFLLSNYWLKADPINIINLGFENGDFSGWTGYTWIYRTDNPSLSTSKVKGIVNGRQTIMSDQTAYDANTGGKLKIIPDGYKYSAKLGTTTKGGLHQSLSYTMKVDSSNALLVWKFAVVLMDPLRNHQKFEEPRFTITLLDEKGDTIPDCSNYDVYASDARISGFQTYYPPGSDEPIVWRDWTTVGANLLPYYGQTVTIEFMSADCTHKGHYGYGYFVLDCMPLRITIDYCNSDSEATLSAPSGFSSYLWKDASGNVVDSKQDFLIDDPKEGETFYCEMESETSCSVTLSSEIARYEQQAEFTSRMLDCFSNEVQFTNLSTHTRGTLSYLWDFGDGNTSAEKDPVYKFETSGIHRVGLILYNPPSGCTDTLYKDVESFSPPLVGFEGNTTYCPDSDTKLTAYGAFSYEWSTGDTTDAITFGPPGGNYWFLGHSSEGCVSDTIHFTISEEPDWPFSIVGDTFLCQGTTGKLLAVGAVDYSWNTGDTSDSILVFTGGDYRVTGKNERGCSKETAVTVVEEPFPDFDFTLSTHSINKRHNSVECSVTSKDDNLSYEWDMGDGTTSNESGLIHYYTETTKLITYNVNITVTNEYGCSITKSTFVNVDIFVPNVFTPNNDGVNDLFMPGYNLKIFNRHGIVLYNGQDGWDGYYKGRALDPDTYFYVLNYIDANQKNRVKTGYVTLER